MIADDFLIFSKLINYFFLKLCDTSLALSSYCSSRLPTREGKSHHVASKTHAFLPSHLSNCCSCSITRRCELPYSVYLSLQSPTVLNSTWVVCSISTSRLKTVDHAPVKQPGHTDATKTGLTDVLTVWVRHWVSRTVSWPEAGEVVRRERECVPSLAVTLLLGLCSRAPWLPQLPQGRVTILNTRTHPFRVQLT